MFLTSLSHLLSHSLHQSRSHNDDLIKRYSFHFLCLIWPFHRWRHYFNESRAKPFITRPVFRLSVRPSQGAAYVLLSVYLFLCLPWVLQKTFLLPSFRLSLNLSFTSECYFCAFFEVLFWEQLSLVCSFLLEFTHLHTHTHSLPLSIA